VSRTPSKFNFVSRSRDIGPDSHTRHILSGAKAFRFRRKGVLAEQKVAMELRGALLFVSSFGFDASYSPWADAVFLAVLLSRSRDIPSTRGSRVSSKGDWLPSPREVSRARKRFVVNDRRTRRLFRLFSLSALSPFVSIIALHNDKLRSIHNISDICLHCYIN